MAPTWIVLVLVWATFVRCRQVTVVVDDSDPRIIYSDNAPWYWIASSPSCTCAASLGLDASQLHSGTWHAAINTAYASFTFEGTGVDVFSAYRDAPDRLTNVTFVLDGQTQGAFVQFGQASDWKYNYHAFTASNLTEGRHELIIQGGSTNLFVLDHITYTRSSGRSVVGPIVGSVIGGVALLVATASSLWFFGYFGSPAVPAGTDYSLAIRGLDGIGPFADPAAPASLVTTTTAEVIATNTVVTVTCFGGLTAPRDVITARMTALVARNLKDGVHPFIIPIVGFAYVSDKASLISAEVQTTELGAYIAGRTRAQRFSLVLDVCDGLQHLHKCGIVHSDLKPSNVVVNQGGRAMLRGHGAAGVAGRKAGELYDARYSALEILDEARFNFMSDVFSLGRVILFIMTGEAPYVNLKHDSEVILAQLEDISPERNDYQDGLGGEENDDLWALIVRCWNPAPQQRPRMPEVIRSLFGQNVEVEDNDNPGPEDGDESDADDTQPGAEAVVEANPGATRVSRDEPMMSAERSTR